MIWMEIRCEKRSGDNGNCFSHSNDDITLGSHDTQQAVKDAFREIKSIALINGYAFTKEGFICPSCVKFFGIDNVH